MNMFKNLAVMALVVGFVACGGDSSTSSAGSPTGANDDDSSSSVVSSSSSVVPGSSSVIPSDVEGSSGSSEIANSASSSSSKKDDENTLSSAKEDESSSSEYDPDCVEGDHRTTQMMENTFYDTCRNGRWEIDSVVSGPEPSPYPNMDSIFAGYKGTYGSFTDPRDGHVYKTVSANKKTYTGSRVIEIFAQNLNYGTQILSTAESFDDSVVEKVCNEDDSWYCDNYFGGMYSWSEAMGLPKACDSLSGDSVAACKIPDGLYQGICPEGWHIPYRSDLDPFICEDWAGNRYVGCSYSNILWDTKDTYTNETGLSIIPIKPGYFAYFWMQEEVSATKAKYIRATTGEFSPGGTFTDWVKSSPRSVRCVRDYETD